MANTWICIRHPDKVGDKEGVYLGNQATITEKGRSQINEIIKRLASWNIKPEMVLGSSLERSVLLAKHVAFHLNLPVHTNQLFNEIDKPEFLVGERRTSRVHEQTMRAIRKLFDENKVPPGVRVKKRTELERETRETFKCIEQFSCDTVLLVGHAKRIASYAHWILKNEKTLRGYYQEADRNLVFDTTGITIFVRKPDRRTGRIHWHIQSLNDTAHAEYEENTDLIELAKKL